MTKAVATSPDTHVIWANPTFVLDPAEYDDPLNEEAIRTRLTASPMLRLDGAVTLAPVGSQLRVGVEELWCGPVSGPPEDATERDAVFLEAALRRHLPGMLKFSPGEFGVPCRVKVSSETTELGGVPARRPASLGPALLWATADLRLANKKDGRVWTEKDVTVALNRTALLHVEHVAVREAQHATSVWFELTFGPVHSGTTELQDTANHILVEALIRSLLPATVDFSIRAWDHYALSRENTDHMVEACEADPVAPSWRSKVWWFVEDAVRARE